MWNFIHIPKVAGSSLHQLIGGGQPIGYCGHVRAIDVPFFCFVRNPYHRLISAYNYLKMGGGQNDLDLSYKASLEKYNSFDDFVFAIEPDRLMDKIIHIKPMYWFVCDDNRKIVIDRIFKIEEPEKIDEFLSGFGLPPLSDTRINESYGNLIDLNRDTVREINRLYYFDFELFGYEKLESVYTEERLPKRNGWD